MEECTEGLRRQWEEAVPRAGFWRSSLSLGTRLFPYVAMNRLNNGLTQPSKQDNSHFSSSNNLVG